jgi:hypothetical protein
MSAGTLALFDVRDFARLTFLRSILVPIGQCEVQHHNNTDTERHTWVIGHNAKVWPPSRRRYQKKICFLPHSCFFFDPALVCFINHASQSAKQAAQVMKRARLAY